MHYSYILDSLLVCHKCDNKRCVNPLHLYLGTYSDNMNDRINRDPESLGKARNYSNLTRSDAKQMKYLHNIGINYTAIGEMFHVHGSTASNIIKDKTIWFREDRTL